MGKLEQREVFTHSLNHSGTPLLPHSLPHSLTNPPPSHALRVDDNKECTIIPIV